jgi:putative addiction module component (TIGR02574 family)
MIDNLIDLEQKAAQLSLDERAQFALYLLESLEPVETGDIATAWRVEAESRLAQVERGLDVISPAEQVFENLQRRLN